MHLSFSLLDRFLENGSLFTHCANLFRLCVYFIQFNSNYENKCLWKILKKLKFFDDKMLAYNFRLSLKIPN